MKQIREPAYFDSLAGMLRKFDKYARKDLFTGSTREEFEAWRGAARRTLHSLLGMEKMERPAPADRLLERVTLPDGIVREKVLLCTEADIYMPCYILIPPQGGGGVFLALPGHKGVGKESVAGLRDNPVVADAIDYYNYDYGYQLARLGCVAVCPDSRGFGQRRDKSRQGENRACLLSSSCYELAHMAEPLGETVAGMQLWDNMALIDYLERRGEWDLSELGCLGFSGGGMQTLWLAAMDDRVRQAYISGYLYGVRDALLILNSNCNCNYVPHLWEHFDMGDIASLIAPRPLMIQSCREDDLNGPRGMENVYEQMEVIRQAYDLYGVPQRLVHDVCPGPHHWHSERLPETTAQFRAFLREDAEKRPTKQPQAEGKEMPF